MRRRDAGQAAVHSGPHRARAASGAGTSCPRHHPHALPTKLRRAARRPGPATRLQCYCCRWPGAQVRPPGPRLAATRLGHGPGLRRCKPVPSLRPAATSVPPSLPPPWHSLCGQSTSHIRSLASPPTIHITTGEPIVLIQTGEPAALNNSLRAPTAFGRRQPSVAGVVRWCRFAK